MPTPPPQKMFRAKGTALHHQLFLALRTKIFDGVYPAGSMLPTEDELCSQFGVSRITVRRALSDLEAAALVDRKQGRGTIVRENTVSIRPAATSEYIDNLRRTADVTQAEVLSLEKVPAPAAIAQLLAIGERENAIHTVRLRSFETIPVMVTDAWMPGALGIHLTQGKLEKKPLHRLLKQHGVRAGKVVQEITAIAADIAQAELLAVPLAAPLLKLTRLLYDANGKPFQHLTATIVPERSRLLMEVAMTDIETFAAGYIIHG